MQSASIAYAVLAAAGLWLGLRWFERVNLYIPSRALDAHPGSYGLPYAEEWLEASDGVRLHAWSIPGAEDGPVILFLHGNGGNISHRLEKARLFHELGASVFLLDYRGYGRSAGAPSEPGTYRDAEAAFRRLVLERGVRQDLLVFYGESLGGAVAAELALRHRPAALILDSTFTSTVEMARLIFPSVPLHRVVRWRYDTVAKLPRIACPVLVLHSPEDEIIPFELGRRLFDAAREPKELVRLRGDHNDGFRTTGPDYPAAIGRFLRRHLPARPAQAG